MGVIKNELESSDEKWIIGMMKSLFAIIVITIELEQRFVNGHFSVSHSECLEIPQHLLCLLSLRVPFWARERRESIMSAEKKHSFHLGIK